MLDKSEFLILTEIEGSKVKHTQRSLSKKCNMSVGSVNKTINSLNEKKYLIDMALTSDGVMALEPYRVKKAVFIAAGFGSRLAPITLNTPKPLVRVNGTRMIETMLDAVTAVGIDEIYIVTGYLSEQFDVLLKKYPTIKLIENKRFNEGNNILSAALVCDKFSNAYILDGDIVLKNKNLITKYQYSNNYLGIFKDKTDDWCLKTKKNNTIIDSISVGGQNCYQWVGISYWDEESGRKLATDIPFVIDMPGGKERYWDQVALEYCKKNYVVNVRPCNECDVMEIDSFAELKAIDKSYAI